MGAGGAGAWLLSTLFKLFRRDWQDTKAGTAQQQVIDSLREELERKDKELVRREGEITVLVKEKAWQMEQLAELPRLRREVEKLEAKVQMLAALLDHFLQAGMVGGEKSQREVMTTVSQILKAQTEVEHVAAV